MGNTCGRGPRAVSLAELQDIATGARLEVNQGCVPNSPVSEGDAADYARKRGLSYPSNGEFDWGGRGNGCPMCSDPLGGYGCDECKNTIGGSRPTVKRVAYKGDKKTCCLSGAALDGPATCDPEWRSLGKGKCDDVMQEYCAGDRLKSTECRSWLSQRPAMRGWYDEKVRQYCAAHPDDTTEFCSCLNLPASLTSSSKLSGIAMQPSCYYQPCSSGKGYRTQTLDDDKTRCSTIQICNQDITVGSVTGSTIEQIRQTCGLSDFSSVTESDASAFTTTPAPVGGQQGSTPAPAPPSQELGWAEKEYVGLAGKYWATIGAIVVLLIIIIAAALLARKSKG
jgi:hypothetical protein